MYGWAISQKLPVDGFKWVEKLSKFNESFIKNYDETSDKGYILEVDVEYHKELFNLHKDLPFLPKREKINKYKKLICSIEDNEKYFVHIRALKQVLNHGLKLNQSMGTEQNCVTWILIGLLFMLKLKIFKKMLQVMLKDDLIHLTIMKMIKDLFQ